MMPDVSPLVSFGQKCWRRFNARLVKLSKQKTFRRHYLVASLLLLLASTIYWAVLGANLQLHNADQLSDPYMFATWATFHGAVFPAAHTFLLKWPIFWLVSVAGISAHSLLAATVGVVLVTVAVLAYVLSRIERRPLVLGTICLGLALALLLVPAQPYAGGILPVNMAMLTTRNLEYAVYLVCLLLFVRAERFRSSRFYWGAGLLSLLIASDKLFLSLSAGGALIALIGYALVRNWSQVTFASRWLVGSIVSAIGSSVLLLLITALHITHLSGGSGTGPYGLVSGAKNVILGSIYAVLGLFTNTGANPVYDNRVVGRLPGSLFDRLFSLSGLVHLIAAAGLVYALVLVWRLVWPSLHVLPKRPARPAVATNLSLALIASTIAAFGVFIFTDHYYAVDARYLTISLFALSVTAATALRTRRWRHPERLLLTGIVLLAGLIAGSFAAHGATSHQTAAFSAIDTRNQLIVQTLAHHKVDVLVGDYWRVLPIKLAAHGSLTALPLTGCIQPAGALTSSVWQPDLATHSFAYLVTLDGSLTNFPNCTLPQITKAYGRPNATQVIAGTLGSPKEALLFYDKGSRAVQPVHPPQPAPEVIKPIGLNQLSDTTCTQPTVMNIVAHQDDDLLFLSPDLLHNIHAGDCVRTVFLTAGDAGHDRFYWLDRQLGSEAAYSNMLHSSAVWDQQTVEIAAGEYVTVAAPRGNNKVSLIFFNLPDGNLAGQGFPDSGNQSLAELRSGALPHIRTVDGQSVYTSGQLVSALSSLMVAYQPAEIHTQADVVSQAYPDHSDHMTTGLYAEAGAAQYDQQHFGGALSIPVKRYIGYPVHGYSANVSGNDLAQKQSAFFAYGQYDGGVCHSLSQCSQTPTYGAYISRQYQENASQQ